MNAGRTQARGFTLVEVIVSLGILSLIMLATISALRTFGQTQVSLDKMIDRVDEVRTVSSFLRDTFESSVVGPGSSGSGLSIGGSGSEGSYLRGTAAAMDWKAFVQFGEGYGGAFLVRLERDQDVLRLRWQDIPRSMRNVSWEGTDHRDLVDQLEILEIDYLPEFDDDWQSEWLEQDSPALVRMTIKARGRYWPELILRVQR